MKKGVIATCVMTGALISGYSPAFGADSANIEERLKQLEEKVGTVLKGHEELEYAGTPDHQDKHLTHKEVVVTPLTFGFGATMVIQGTSGNNDNTGRDDNTDGSFSSDLEINAQIGAGSAFVLIEAGDGDGLQADELNPAWGVNTDSNNLGSSLQVSELWYELPFMNNMFTVTAGKLDITNYFDGNSVANDETTQFLANGFVNSIAIEFPGYAPGIRLTASPIELVDITVAAQSADADPWEDIFAKSFWMAEVDVKPDFGGLKGNYRLYSWSNGSNHTQFSDATKTTETGSGFGISLDQQVIQDVTLFARFGTQDKKVYQFTTVWSAGLGVSGNIWGRGDDTLGLAYGSAALSGDYKDANTGSTSDEKHFEIYYNVKINEKLSITPDIQFVQGEQGIDDRKDVWIGGVRTQLTF